MDLSWVKSKDRRCPDVVMAQKLLHGPDVVATFEQVSREGIPERMGRGPFRRLVCRLGQSTHLFFKASCKEVTNCGRSCRTVCHRTSKLISK
jgi:hypothetical protein